ncbi:ATP-dependent DNA helicase RecG [Peptoanaerobacter stomatis]|uniref:ATP-dependent DNA helicase RecG n=1 Tax=Peptoanaerobacter stomatis TaxID=796937 RepID=V9HPN0_9FIRM|nr:ATP-dependent DNA helicase RecG [Peptoanaerobacter stomatis]EHL15668.1 ATP-dependent DNA helicase RecG [Peptoanaerobacter stomatis]
MNLNDNVINLPKIGEKKQKVLQNMGVSTIYDLLHYFPRKYEDRSIFKKLNEIKAKEKASVKAKIIRFEKVNLKFKKSIINIYVSDDTSTACIKLFNNNFILPELEKGRYIFFYGQAEENYDLLQFNSPEIEFDKAEKKIGMIYPIYPLSNGIKNSEILSAVKYSIENADMTSLEYLPNEYLEKYRLIPTYDAIKNIHMPKNINILKQSRYRCIFNEFFELNIFLNAQKSNVQKSVGIKFKKSENINDIIKKLPFELTNAQKKVLDDIFSDMNKDVPMRRLIQGDVGSGKTIVAFLSIYNSCMNGYQSVFMVPTEVLAVQHYENALDFFKNTDIKVKLLIGSTKNKTKLYEEIENGEVNVVIGTQALIQDKVIFKKLGLVITDEQHRFGVNQRKKLEEKSNENPDIIVMSATPIPRTLSLVIHKDLDVSVIGELPQNRLPIKTVAERKINEQKIFEFIKKQVQIGRQAYIVCPLVEENYDLDLISVNELYEKLLDIFPKEYSIKVLHGKMKAKEKEDILKDFQENNINILISTTVIEVGINVPNATIMVIYDAQRFGLSQLHQLRGRVGRGDKQSYCVLLYDNANKITMQRIQTLVDTNDGFEIAKKDLQLRGAGEIFGVKQHGIPEFKIGDIMQNIDILEFAQKCANEVMDHMDSRYITNIIETIYSRMNIS